MPTTPTAPTTTPPPITTVPAPTATTNTEPDSGDEEPIRVPATFVIRGGRFVPRTISVPAFLTVALTVASGDGRAHRVVLRAPGGPRTLRVPAGGRARLRLTGLKRGRYRLSADGGSATATLVSGATPGP